MVFFIRKNKRIQITVTKGRKEKLENKDGIVGINYKERGLGRWVELMKQKQKGKEKKAGF